MKKCGKCKEEKSKADFYRQKQAKDGYSGYCKDCSKIGVIEWKEKNKEKISLCKKMYYEKNKESCNLNSKKWAENNKEKAMACSKRWREENKGRVCFHATKRHLLKKLSMPKWANEFFISEIYELSAMRTKMTGVKWEVDHIIPLNGKNVCGLHVETNLRVILASENRAKKNKFIESLL